MIKYIEGDAFKVKTNYLAHQVNTLGVMGSGIALDVKKNYPNVFIEYARRCKELGDGLLGTYQAVKADASSLVILNCFTQKGISRTQRVTDYDAIKKVFKNIEKATKEGKVITIPYKYGCGLANGEWHIVHQIMKDIFSDSKVVLQIVRRFPWTEDEMK